MIRVGEKIKLLKGGVLRKTFSLFIFLVLLWGCALTATRPNQEMSDTAASIRAAKEVQADTLAPDLYRRANEWFFRSKHEYKFKNFKLAREYAEKARHLAEQAEFEAIRSGGNRTEQMGDIAPAAGPGAEDSKAKPYDYPSPGGTPADVYEQRKAEDEAKRQPPPAPSPTYVPVPVPLSPTFR
jgi:hypothetical protein